MLYVYQIHLPNSTKLSMKMTDQSIHPSEKVESIYLSDYVYIHHDNNTNTHMGGSGREGYLRYLMHILPAGYTG